MEAFIATVLYTFLGLVIFFIALLGMEIMTKFSIRTKISEEGNIALAIVLGSIIVSLGMIISSAIQ
ncbi:hypothetical protein MNB_SV-13-1821 [hydrothermal vent metagenome]|uniref:DUF350 domain-containing protein n=1 Tax=hydrothermal vent metagenome TaxID=652676 RepID=A0A1W1BLE5_9ZZZZ